MALSDAGKEQVKLHAAFLNNLGVAAVVIGFLTPSLSFQEIPADAQPWAYRQIAGIVAGLIIGLYFRWSAHRHLRKLD